MKIISRFFIFTFTVLFLSFAYLSLVGIETSSFNNQIQKNLKNIDTNLDIKLNTVKLKLDPISFKLNLKTVGPTIFYRDKGIELEIETSAIENVALLEAVERMNLDAIPKSHKRGLTSMKEETRQLKEQAEAAEELNKRLQEENTDLVRKLAISRRSAGEGKQSEEALEEALADAKEENEKRVRDTNQFKQMQRMMQKQAADIRELRKRIQAYDPDEDADEKLE